MMETKADAVVTALDAFERCLIRMEQRGFIRDEAYLCKLILKAISFVYRQMVKGCFPDRRTFSDAMNAIGEAIRAYNETDDQTMVQGVVEGMQAMTGFDVIKSSVMCQLAREKAIQEVSNHSNPAENQDLKQ